MRTRLALAALALASLAAPLAVTAPALASGGDAVRTHGGCDGSPTWKLKAKHDDGRIETEWEVDSNRGGQTWRVRIRDNGVLVVATRATTGGASGSFSVERRIANRAGTDSLVARAYNLSSGQTCVGRLSL
jgi:hypothetical protein